LGTPYIFVTPDEIAARPGKTTAIKTQIKTITRTVMSVRRYENPNMVQYRLQKDGSINRMIIA
jgi:hypothetical protein